MSVAPKGSKPIKSDRVITPGERAAAQAALEAGESPNGAGPMEESGARLRREDGRMIFQISDVDLLLPRKWKRFKFMRRLRSGDLWGALEAIWPPTNDKDGEEEVHPELAKLEELEVDEDEFRLTIERLGETLMGKGDGKNS